MKTAFRLIIGILIIAILLVLFDPAAILSVIVSARPEYLVLALLVYAFTYLILTFRWRFILSAMGETLSLGHAYQAFVGGVLLSDLTPGRIGDLSRPFLVRDEIDLNKGIVSFAIDRYADLLTIAVLGFTGLVFLSVPGGKTYLIPAACLLVLALLPFALFWLKRPLAIRAVERLGSTRIITFMHTLDDAAGQVPHLPSLMASSILLTTAAWVTHAARVVLIARAVGYSVSLLALTLLQPLVSALSLVPISLSGLGLVEGGLAAVLAGLGVPATVGVSIALLDRGITMAFHLLVGGKNAIKLV
ncbi:Lysylphosphatidylglycerol synthase TM region [anaerobic digester metagenome]